MNFMKLKNKPIQKKYKKQLKPKFFRKSFKYPMKNNILLRNMKKI